MNWRDEYLQRERFCGNVAIATVILAIALFIGVLVVLTFCK